MTAENSHRHWGARINLLDLSRATEQTAVAASTLFGRGKSDKDLRELSMNAMLGYLRLAALKQARIVFWDHKDTSAIDELEEIDGVPVVELEEPVGPSDGRQGDMEFVISPIDGKRAAAKGEEGGSISVLAAGERGSFADPTSGGADPSSSVSGSERFLVITVSAQLHELMKTAVGEAHEGQTSPPTTYFDLLFRRWKDSKLSAGADEPKSGQSYGARLIKSRKGFEDGLTRFIRESLDLSVVSELIRKSLNALPTAAALMHVEGGPIEEWMGPIRSHLRTRYLHGSSVATSLTALVHENATHIAFAIARRAHAILSAVAARALGGEAILIRLVPCKTSKDRSKSKIPRNDEATLIGYDVVRPCPIYLSKSFVPKDNVVFVATGISDQPVLRGVRYSPGGIASTQTLCLSIMSQSRRDLRRDIAVAKFSVWMSDGTQKPLSELINPPAQTAKPSSPTPGVVTTDAAKLKRKRAAKNTSDVQVSGQ